LTVCNLYEKYNEEGIIMKKTKITFLILFIVNIKILFSQEIEYVTFQHRALSINIKYPSIWINYWFYDDYSEIDYSDLSQNEIENMVRIYRYYPVFYIRKYNEIYNGINPSVRVTLLPHIYNLFSFNDLYMALYNEDQANLILYAEYLNREINTIVAILSYEKTIIQRINTQYIGNRSILHFKTEDYVLDSNIVNENFYKIVEYFLFIENDYIIVVEMSYSRTINDNDKNELIYIVNNIRIK
jgi:hypothetical protein